MDLERETFGKIHTRSIDRTGSLIESLEYETETLFGIFNFKPKFYSISLTTKPESGSHARQIKSLIKHKKSNGSLHWIFRP